MTITPDQLVNREVHYCVSHLVSTLARGAFNCSTFNETAKELDSMCEQAFDLACPIDDWEEAAREAGYDIGPNGEIYSDAELQGHWDADLAGWKSWAQCCQDNDIEPHQREVYEHWIVSDWLADQLAERGEMVDKDFAGLIVWARTTTGQAIAQDSVIVAICDALNA